MSASFMPLFIIGDENESVAEELEQPQSVADITSWNLVASTSRTVEDALFNLLKNEDERVLVAKFFSVMRSKGILTTDPRLRETMQKIQKLQQQRILENANDAFNLSLEKESFFECISDCIDLIAKALKLELVIPNWFSFCKLIGLIYEECSSIDDGKIERFKIADYIPQATAQPQKSWGVAVCTIDGQRAAWGDYALPWCMQSVCKPFIYGIALDTLGDETVHKYVGQEPSGGLSDDISLDSHNRPHNPMINAGTIVILSLLKVPSTCRYATLVSTITSLAFGNAHV
ncbi:unnamed protein product [Soboliphyme baturini]|uniref:glutaminase n=1 Tax=Soboliphyme baturini TaxID=241478 RepID=A0A183J0R2_9BILA|nr:unnamed protein product [Soboliphyme baturini]